MLKTLQKARFLHAHHLVVPVNSWPISHVAVCQNGGKKQTDKPVGLVVPLCLWDIMQVGSLLFLRCECMSMGTSVGVCERQRDSEWPSNKNAWADLKILQIFPLTHCNPPSVAWPYYPGGGQGLPNFFAFTSAFTNKAFFFFFYQVFSKRVVLYGHHWWLHYLFSFFVTCTYFPVWKCVSE